MVAQTNKVYGFMGLRFKLLIHITDSLKRAQVTTLHKKNDPMNKSILDLTAFSPQYLNYMKKSFQNNI